MKSFIIFYCICFSSFAFAQQEQLGLITKDTTQKPWSFSFWVGYSIYHDQENNLLPILYVDHHKLHIEARYNYEDKTTASVFAGYKLSAGNALLFDATPMIGFVFGKTNGIAPGLETALSYKKFDLYTETEYLLDFADNSNNFLYTYTELAYTLNKFRAGLTTQRSRIYEGDLDVQRGLFATYEFGKFIPGIKGYNFFSDNFYFSIQCMVVF
jgi:hypothetical protein